MSDLTPFASQALPITIPISPQKFCPQPSTKVEFTVDSTSESSSSGDPEQQQQQQEGEDGVLDKQQSQKDSEGNSSLFYCKCGKSYNRNASLFNHIRIKHDNKITEWKVFEGMRKQGRPKKNCQLPTPPPPPPSGLGGSTLNQQQQQLQQQQQQQPLNKPHQMQYQQPQQFMHFTNPHIQQFNMQPQYMYQVPQGYPHHPRNQPHFWQDGIQKEKSMGNNITMVPSHQSLIQNEIPSNKELYINQEDPTIHLGGSMSRQHSVIQSSYTEGIANRKPSSREVEMMQPPMVTMDMSQDRMEQKPRSSLSTDLIVEFKELLIDDKTDRIGLEKSKEYEIIKKAFAYQGDLFQKHQVGFSQYREEFEGLYLLIRFWINYIRPECINDIVEGFLSFSFTRITGVPENPRSDLIANYLQRFKKVYERYAGKVRYNYRSLAPTPVLPQWTHFQQPNYSNGYSEPRNRQMNAIPFRHPQMPIPPHQGFYGRVQSI